MRSIKFISKELPNYFAEISSRLRLDRPPRSILFHPVNEMALDLYKELKNNELLNGVSIFGSEFTQDIHDINIKLITENIEPDLIVFFCDQKIRVSQSLLSYLDLENGEIIAPIISIHSSFHSLFLISIPKSGTHLLYKLAETLGYTPAIECPEKTEPQNWYCIQGTNSHTEAKDFLIESSKDHYFANRNHPFTYSPCLFIYRHPLDILVSEANYYHKLGNTVFSGYLNSLNFQERLLKLTNDPILLGTIRERIIRFAAWLEFQNVIPISFEELIGSKGGGCDKAQSNLIWSLLLKLHISGNPDELASKVFSTFSATFHKGQIGTYPEYLTPEVKHALSLLPQDYLDIFGYQNKSDYSAQLDFNMTKSSRIEEFKARALTVSPRLFDDLPICAEYGYQDHNIIKFRGKYFAVPLTSGYIDLNEMNETELNKLIQDERILTVKTLVAKNRS